MKSYVALGFSILILFFLSACDFILPNESFKFYDADGTLLYESTDSRGVLPNYELPQDTEMWEYLNWIDTGEFEKTASRRPQYSFFVGNVFQIIVYNLGMQPIANGTGFVINDSGWFITNSHIMEDGYFAEAIFDVKDNANREQFTKLKINLASYNDPTKDIFVGKIDNYSIIGDAYFKQFEYNTAYQQGDLTYSIGYPNSSLNLQIHEGNIESDLTSIYDKVFSGISYIGSTSYIAPGSSGGILVNENLEVIGMTTIGVTDSLGNFTLGGAIEAFNYIDIIQSTNSLSLVDYSLFMHPDEKIFIGYFKEAMDHEGSESIRTEFDDFVRYTYTWEDEGINDEGTAYTYLTTFIIDSDGWMSYKSNYYWANSGRREIEFSGYYSNRDGLRNFTYDFKFTWSPTSWYTVKSTNINYSENIQLTLNNYSTTKAFNNTISSRNIEYAKEQFNYVYEWLTNDMARFE